MALVPFPNSKAPSSLKKGATGWPVYGLQSGLNVVLRGSLKTDGAFGPATEGAVEAFQQRSKLTVDGIAGPTTQKALCLAVLDHMDLGKLPEGLPQSLMEGEGGYNFGAVNWSVPGGVDCGLMQHRVYEPYGPSALLDAYNAPVAILDACNDVYDRAFGNPARKIVGFIDKPWVKSLAQTKRKQQALRLALLAHNWPVGANDIAQDGKLTRPDDPATWLPRDKHGDLIVKFPDGKLVQTRLEWCQFYALGGPHGPARMAKYVDRWPR